MPILERFCRDPDEEVRSTVASGFHEILTHRKNCASSKSSNDQEQPQLLNPFVELLSSGSGDVVQQLTANLHLILPVLYKDINVAGNNKKTVGICAIFSIFCFHRLERDFDKTQPNFGQLQFAATWFWLMARP